MTLGIPTSLLAQMRADVALLLPDTAVISTAGTAIASDGSPLDGVYTPVSGGTVACRLDPIQSRASNSAALAGGEVLVFDRILTVPYNAPLATNYRVAVGSENYEIVQLMDDHSWRVSRRAYVARIE